MSLIKTLRELGNFDGTTGSYGNRDERLDELEVLTSRWRRLTDCEVKVVSSEFEDLSRWSNYETHVYEVKEGDEVAYFEFGEERPATEQQDGMDCSYHFQEVIPQEVKIIKYIPK